MAASASPEDETITSNVASPVPSTRTHIEADEDFEHDSTFGGDRASIASSSTSLATAITRYRFEHGRRYHAYQEGSYNFPNDEQELNRIDIEHQNQLVQMHGRLHYCPLRDPKQILDLGTGTGIWAIAMADEYPDCQILGQDLHPEQPSWVPPNCKFEVDDFNLEWTYGENRFDMVHQRLIIGSSSDYPTLYAQAFRALKPGGWIEISELAVTMYSDDGTLKPDSALVQWATGLNEAFVKINKRILDVEEYAGLLQQAGFINIDYRIMKRPSCDWPKDPHMKDVGRYCCLNFLEGLEGFTLAPFTRILGWSPDEVAVLVARARAEITKRSIHAYEKGVVCWAQKPYDVI